MKATIIDGKELAKSIKSSLTKALSDLKNQGIVPCLAVILVGENPGSILYVASKKKACAELGILSRDFHLPSTIKEEQLLELITSLNADSLVHGILVQLPLPAALKPQKVIQAIDPYKDVDGFHPYSLGKLFWGEDTFIPCTPYGIVKILEHTGLTLTGLDVTIIGRSNVVGRPLSVLLSRAPYNCTVTVCHSHTHNLASRTRQSDVIVAAVGKPHLLTADMIKPGACVIDVGISRVARKNGYDLKGDIDYNAIAQKASFVTPVPGGVGPMTIVMLMYNTVKAACLQYNRPFKLRDD